MSGSVLDALAHPAQVNLLDDYSGASRAAAGIWANRGNQANALRGQLLQQATGADGNVDMPTYNRLASQAGPAMAPAVAAGLDQSTAIAGQQQTQALKSLDAQSTALDSLGPNATFGQVQAKLDEGLNAGWLQPAGAHAVMIGMPQGDDPQSQATRAHILQTIGDQVRSASERLQSQYGTQHTQTGPDGSTIGFNQNPRTAAVSAPPQAGAPQGTSPETRAALQKITIEDPQHPGTYIEVYRPRMDLPGASGSTSPGASAASAAAPRSGGSAPPVPSPTAGGGVYRPRQVAGAPAATPAPATAQSPATPGDTTGLIRAAPPQGQPTTLAADIEAYKKAQFGLPAQQTSDQNMSMALDALRRTTTGPGTDNTHALFAYLQSAGLLPQGATDEIKNNQLFRKLTERRVAELGMAAGTDAGRALAQQSNAGTLLNNPANLEVLRNDIGKNRQAMLPILMEKNGGSTFGANTQKIGTPGYVDFRGLNWDHYSQPEQAKILNSVKGNKAADTALHRAIGLSSGLSFGADSKAP